MFEYFSKVFSGEKLFNFRSEIESENTFKHILFDNEFTSYANEVNVIQIE